MLYIDTGIKGLVTWLQAASAKAESRVDFRKQK